MSEHNLLGDLSAFGSHCLANEANIEEISTSHLSQANSQLDIPPCLALWMYSMFGGKKNRGTEKARCVKHGRRLVPRRNDGEQSKNL